MTQKKIKKYSMTICVLFALTYIVIGGFNYKNLFEVKQDWQAKNGEYVRLQKKIKEIKASLERFEIEKEEFQQYLFSEKDIPAFLEGISEYAYKANGNITDMKTKRFKPVKSAIGAAQAKVRGRKMKKSPSKKKSAQSKQKFLTLAAMPINIKLEGDYSDFFDFLWQLEDFKQLLTISDVEIVMREKEYPKLKCAFILKIYSLKSLKEIDSR